MSNKQLLAVLVLIFFSVPAAVAETDCAACLQDHETICQDECFGISDSQEGERCQIDCRFEKCKSSCGDSEECKSCKAKANKNCVTTCTDKKTTIAEKAGCQRSCVAENCKKECK